MAVVSDFPEVLAELTNEGGYFAEQVFNADEIGLWGVPVHIYCNRKKVYQAIEQVKNG